MLALDLSNGQCPMDIVHSMDFIQTVSIISYILSMVHFQKHLYPHCEITFKMYNEEDKQKRQEIFRTLL